MKYFWWVTGQSTLADRMEDCFIGQSASVWVRKQVFDAVSRLYAKFDCPVAHRNISFLPTAHDCETGLQTFKT